ncbi:MAG TPA: hypothetical protein VIM64_09555 [Puia sp.]
MLNKDTQKKLLKALKFSDEDITALVDPEEEKTIDIPALKVYTEEEFTEVSNNLKESGKGAHTKAGRELAIKDLKEKTGLEFDGKDPETFLNQYKEKVIAEAKIPASEAAKQWEAEKKQLQDKLTAADQRAASLESDKKMAQFDATLLRSFPAERKTDLSDDDRLTLVKTKITENTVDGKTFYEYKGKRLQDDKVNDLSLSDAVAHVFKEEKWIGEAVTGGTQKPALGGSAGKTVYKGMTEIRESWKTRGISETSEAALAEIRQAKADNPQFDLYS